ncbi:MAG: hypothetical protein DRJ69_05710 [Thermoprotei archaeon]|nr:MAG: hypothetical protein DRJ69_05710 [Thermoprotei archaeon]
MMGIEGKIRCLKAALVELRRRKGDLSGSGQLVLQRQNVSRRDWEVVLAVPVSKVYAKPQIARSLIIAAGLDPDGRDGVLLQAYL